MRFQIASDLHLEMLSRFPGYRVIEPAPGADALLLAGDIHEHTHAVHTFADWPVPVIYVHGNHEAFRAHYWGVTREISRVSKDSNFHHLERRKLVLGNVRILGCCLWTDYALTGNPHTTMNQARGVMPDHQLIRTREGGYFRPEEARNEFLKSKEWLEKELGEDFAGKTLVMTHHAPHPNSIAERHKKDPLSSAFASDLTVLISKANYWIHGHLHECSSYEVNGCRVIANPRGVALNRNYAVSVDKLEWENASFNPRLVIEV